MKYVEGFRDQGFVLPEVESLKVQSLWLLKKALPSREEPDIRIARHAFILTLTRYYKPEAW